MIGQELEPQGQQQLRSGRAPKIALDLAVIPWSRRPAFLMKTLAGATRKHQVKKITEADEVKSVRVMGRCGLYKRGGGGR